MPAFLMLLNSSMNRVCMYTALSAAEFVPRVKWCGVAYSDLKDTWSTRTLRHDTIRLTLYKISRVG